MSLIVTRRPLWLFAVKSTRYTSNSLQLRSCNQFGMHSIQQISSTMRQLTADLKLTRETLYAAHSQYITVFFISHFHYNDIIMSAMASQITGVSSVYSTVCSGTDQREYQSSASLAFVRGIPRWPVNPSHKGPVMRKFFPFDDVIVSLLQGTQKRRAARDRLCKPYVYVRAASEQLHWNIEWLGFC